MVERKYHEVSETMARVANDANSMRDYKEGSATQEYKRHVDLVYDYVDRIAKVKPNLLEKAQRMAERYSRKLAEYYNSYYRNEASCPSILISGGGNFPVKKKNRQNSRRESLMQDWSYLEEYAQKVKRLLTMEQPILSSDENALEMLQDKLDDLKESQETMKAANKAIRMKDAEKGNEILGDMGYTDEQIKSLREPDFCGRIGFPSYMLTNNNANIRRIEERIRSLQAAKDKGTTETENGICKVVENTEAMRIQLVFAGKPEAAVRDILKSNGFRWSPSYGAWQRQLTPNGKRACERALKQIGEAQTVF